MWSHFLKDLGYYINSIVITLSSIIECTGWCYPAVDAVFLLFIGCATAADALLFARSYALLALPCLNGGTRTRWRNDIIQAVEEGKVVKVRTNYRISAEHAKALDLPIKPKGKSGANSSSKGPKADRGAAAGSDNNKKSEEAKAAAGRSRPREDGAAAADVKSAAAGRNEEDRGGGGGGSGGGGGPHVAASASPRATKTGAGTSKTGAVEKEKRSAEGWLGPPEPRGARGAASTAGANGDAAAAGVGAEQKPKPAGGGSEQKPKPAGGTGKQKGRPPKTIGWESAGSGGGNASVVSGVSVNHLFSECS